MKLIDQKNVFKFIENLGVKQKNKGKVHAYNLNDDILESNTYMKINFDREVLSFDAMKVSRKLLGEP